MAFKLHNYFRSSTSTRLRIALNLKGLEYEYIGYALLRHEHKSADFLARNPAGLVPVLELDGGTHLAQSLAIIEYLDETRPEPPLLPADPPGRARVRALGHMIACDLHPLNNLRVLRHLEISFGADERAREGWFRHWVAEAFDPLEKILATDGKTGIFCHGDTPGLADICLYAQVWNNRRFDIAPDRWPTIARIFDALERIDAFSAAAPPNQPDAG